MKNINFNLKIIEFVCLVAKYQFTHSSSWTITSKRYQIIGNYRPSVAFVRYRPYSSRFCLSILRNFTYG